MTIKSVQFKAGEIKKNTTPDEAFYYMRLAFSVTFVLHLRAWLYSAFSAPARSEICWAFSRHSSVLWEQMCLHTTHLSNFRNYPWFLRTIPQITSLFFSYVKVSIYYTYSLQLFCLISIFSKIYANNITHYNFCEKSFYLIMFFPTLSTKVSWKHF